MMVAHVLGYGVGQVGHIHAMFVKVRHMQAKFIPAEDSTCMNMHTAPSHTPQDIKCMTIYMRNTIATAQCPLCVIS